MHGRWGYVFLLFSLALVAGLGGFVVWRVGLPAGWLPQTQPTPTAEATGLPERRGVAVAPPPTPAPAPKATTVSTMIDLPGDPVQISRGAAAAPRALQVDLPAKVGASAPKTSFPAFYIALPLVSNDGGYMGKFPEAGGEADSLAEEIALNTAVMAEVAANGGADIASDDDGGDETPPTDNFTLVTKDNSSVLDASPSPDGEPQLKQATLRGVIAQKIADAIAANGFTADSANAIEAAMKASFNVQTLTPGSVALLAGGRQPDGAYGATQFALYQDGEYVGAVAVSENGLVAEAARPSLPDGFLDAGSAPIVSTQHFNLADGLYSAGLRGGAPEPVVREAIGLLGTMTDLHQALRADADFRLLYAKDPRVKATGGGRIVYAGLSGGGGAVDCYTVEGSDELFRCFGQKGATAGGPPQPPTKGGQGGGTGSDSIIQQTDATSVNGILAPVKGAPVTSLFGMRFHPILHILRLHAGMDFGTPVGSPVRAPADGVIEIAGPVSGFGNHIRIQHQGFETSESHLSEIPEAIKPGVAVKQGEIIALSGNTGLSTGPHLHFEFYLNRVAVDPLPHMGQEVKSNIMAGAGEGIVTSAGVPVPPSQSGPGPAAPSGPSAAEAAAFPAFKAQVDAALDAAVH